MPLSDTALRALKQMERRYKRADQRGLYIEVEPNGSKLWRFKYRYEGLEKRIALGRYPDGSERVTRTMASRGCSSVGIGLASITTRRGPRKFMAFMRKLLAPSSARRTVWFPDRVS